MKASSIIGIVVGMLGIAMGATMEGSNIMAVMNPSAMLIVLVGTLGATITGTSFDSVKAIPKLYKKAFSPDIPDLNGRRTPFLTPRPVLHAPSPGCCRHPARSMHHAGDRHSVLQFRVDDAVTANHDRPGCPRSHMRCSAKPSRRL